MTPYTEEQRTRYLLAKLKPSLRTAIITYYTVPARRDDLVSLCTRLESTSKRDGSLVAPKRSADDSQGRRNRFKRPRGGRAKSTLRPASRSAGSPQADRLVVYKEPECYGCYKSGYYKHNCLNLEL